jgi:hypothetical protein
MSETDSFEVRVVAKTKGALEQAVALAMRDHSKGVGWWADVEGWLTFYWDAAGKGAPLPVRTLAADLVPIVWAWLTQHKPIGSAPDTDGDALRGFELQTCSNNAWEYGVLRVRAVWVISGK